METQEAIERIDTLLSDYEISRFHMTELDHEAWRKIRESVIHAINSAKQHETT